MNDMKIHFTPDPLLDEYHTSLQREVPASFASLEKLLGPPRDEADGYKVSAQWVLTGSDGSVVTLYDYGETSLYDIDLPSVEEFRLLPEYRWHIGAKSRKDADTFLRWLQESLKTLE